MRKLTTRLTALLLSGILVIGSVPGSVFAADVDAGQTSEYAEEVYEDGETAEESSEAAKAVDAGAEAAEGENAEESSEAVDGEAADAGVEEEAAGVSEENVADTSEETAAQYYTVTLDANGGYFENELDDAVGEIVEQAEMITRYIPVGGTVAAVPVFTDPDGRTIVFAGWSLERDGELVITGDEEYAPLDNCVLYAVWEAAEAEDAGLADTERETEAVEETESAQEYEDAETRESAQESEGTEAAEDNDIAQETAEEYTEPGTENVQETAPAQEEINSDEEVVETSENSSDSTVEEKETILESSEEEETVKEEEKGGVVDEGNFGENLTWTFDSEGTLTISGTGDQYGFVYADRRPWQKYYSRIKKAVISEGVTGIGNEAFDRCDALESISISNSVKWIGDGAFNDCTCLTSVFIPAGVTEIGETAFYGCSNLSIVSIPDSVTEIGGFAFENTPWINSLGDMAIVNHIFVRYLGSAEGVTIPDGVTKIAPNAFDSCRIKSVTIPEGVTDIGDFAFRGCSSLSSLEIPEGVVSIGSWAFLSCSKLTNVDLPNSLINIGDYAFDGCRCLSEILIPAGVEEIGSYAFWNCSSLKNVMLPAGVTSVRWGLFSGCTNLESVVIPGSVTAIEWGAFNDCNALQDIYFIGEEENWNKVTVSDHNECLQNVNIHFLQKGTITAPSSLMCSLNGDVVSVSATYVGWTGITSAIIRSDPGDGLLISPPVIRPLEDTGILKQAEVTFSVAGRKEGTYNLTLQTNDGAESSTTIICESCFSAVLAEKDKICTYTGSAIEPKPVVSGNDGLVLTEGTDYSLSYKDNIEPGTATVIVTGEGAYSGLSVSLTFEILDDIKINLKKEIKGSPGSQILISADIESKRISPDNSNLTWEITPSDGQEGPVTWGSMSVTAAGEGRYTVHRPVSLSDRGNYLLTLSFGGVSANALISIDVKYYLVFSRVKTIILGEKGLVTATVKAYDPADDPNEESAKITWAVEDSTCADVTYKHLYAGQTVNITGKKPGKTRLVATFSDGSTQSREITIEPAMTVSVGAKLNDDSIDEVERITGYSNVWCTVSLEGFGADSQYLNKFINEVAYNREELENQVDIIKEERKVSEDGLKAWINLRVGYKKNTETIRATFDFASPEENHARKDIHVSKDLTTKLTYRANGDLWKYEDGDEERYRDGNHAFLFSNDYYYEDARNYSNDLAVMSLGLEVASWTSHDFDDRYTETVAREKNLREAFSKLGFKNPVFHKYDTALNNFADLAAFGIASKTITNRDRDDTLIAVAFRGGGYGAEWASNFHLGDNGDALGFRSAANLAAVELKQYIDDLKESGKYTGRIKLWLVGFSRGGAAANLLGHYINEGVLEIDLERKDTFVYTFATPSGQRGDDHSDTNIHNIVSSSDLIPRIVLKKGWGFSKYGTTKTITACYTTKAVEDSFENFTGESLNVGDISEKISVITEWMCEMIPNTNDYTNLVQESMITAYKNNYAEKDSSINILVSAFWGLLNSPAMVGKFLAGPDFANAWDREDYVSAIEIGFKRTVSTYKWLNGDIGIVDALKFALENKGLLAQMHSHYPEHYLAWLESGGIRTMEADTYASLDQSERAEIEAAIRNEFDKAVAKRYDIHCPVDVTVYSSSGSVVGKIENDQVTVDEIPCFADGDKKVVYIPTGDSYHIEMKGTDYGKMDYSVSEYSEEYDLLRTVEFYEVDLSPGIVYEGEVTDQVLDPDETYALTAGNITTVPSIDTARGILEPFTLTVISGETKEYQILKGDQVTILPSVPENDTFIKWITDDPDSVIDDCLKEEATVTMPSHDITITAHLASQHEWSDQYTVDLEPTDDAAGRKSIHCRHCDAVKEGSSVEIPSTGTVPIESGTAGTDLSWILYRNGELILSGTGEMPDWSLSGAPWKEYALQIKKAVIQEGFTNIGKSAFENCSSLAEVSIPAGVTGIEDYAFKGCGTLVDAAIPEGVTRIGKYAFSDCGSLKETIIPGSVKTIENAAFRGCSSLEEVTLPGQLTSIAAYTFMNCSSLRAVVIPEKVTTVSESAFRGCSSLAEVSIPAEVTSMGMYAFYGCVSLTKAVIPEAVSEIDKFTFKGCSSLTNVVIPEGVTIIRGGAFENCEELSYVVLSDKVTEIGSYAFSGCPALEKVCYFGTESQWNEVVINDDDIRHAEILYITDRNSMVYSGITGLSDRTYTGLEITQTPVVSLLGDVLTEGVDYSVSYSNNIEVGDASVIVTGKGDYTGTASASFKIVPAPLTDAEITGLTEKIYTGGAVTQAPVVRIGSVTLTEDTDYTVGYENNIDAGSATVTVTGTGRYEGSVSETFRIRPAEISAAEVTGIESGTYNGKEHLQTPTVRFGSVRLEEGTDYTVSYHDNINAGTATMTITGMGNYEGTRDESFEITPAEISSASVSGIKDKIYTGKEVTQDPVVSVEDEILKYNKDFDLVYRNNIRAGTAGLLICGIGNYEGEISESFEIDPVDISDAAVDGLSEKVFTGEAITQNLSITVGETVLKTGIDYTISYSNNINAGIAQVTLTGRRNYTGKKTAEFEICPASVSKASISGLSDKTYTGKALTQSPAVMLGTTVLNTGTDYSISYENNTNAGTATVTIIGKGNYTGSKNATFTIKKAAQSIAASNLSLTFPKTGTISASGNKGKLTYKSSNTAVATVDSAGKVTAKGAGTAKITITVAATDNYNQATKTITITVNKAAQSITAKAAASSVAVGKTTTVSVTGAKGTKSFKSSDTSIATVSSAGKVTAKKVGTVKITATSAATANYNAASKTVTIKVVPAATASLTAANQATGIKLTWKKVTGANGYKVYRGSTLIKTIASGSTVTYVDTKANTNGTKYTYKVVAKATTGDSTLSKSRVIYRVSRPTVSSVTNSASKKMTVKWGKNAKANGYQIQYSTDKTFKTGNKAVSITSASTVSKVIGSLIKGKTYYVRIRTYKTVGSTKYWSIWSPVKSVKISK